MTDPIVDSYAHDLLEEVHAEAAAAGADLQTTFAEMMLEQFSADGLSENTRAIGVTERHGEISGWGQSSDGRSLDLFLVRYSPRADEAHKTGRTEVSALFGRVENFLARTISGQYPTANADREVTDLCTSLSELFESVQTIRLIIITNARSTMRDPMGHSELLNRKVVRDLWDLRRLANWASSGNKAEPIVAEFPQGVPCLQTTAHDRQGYTNYLAILPGPDLAELYAEHGARLLELNVRSFLQVRTGVNRGILQTIRSSPDRFLAYNNGISATASQVDLDGPAQGPWAIKRIHNLQIVNGGQTTATIYHATRNGIDVRDVLVQMKLTVVDPDLLDEVVPQISAYSNTQNRVTASDLRANTGFHVEVERALRTLWAPATTATKQETHWFYERARGQYATALAREDTRARQRAFRAVNPRAQLFTKSDLAKYENSWAMLPHLVCLGAEKNFVLFTEQLQVAPVNVDKDHCRRLVAKTILFRRADLLIARQAYGGYKSNTVTYTVAKLVHATRSSIDLERVWREQGLTPALDDEIVRLSALVHGILTDPPAGRSNVNEWTKRVECWDLVRERPWTVSDDLAGQMAKVDTSVEDLTVIRSSRPELWRALADWTDTRGDLSAGDQLVAREIARALENGWDPAGKHVTAGAALLHRAQQLGFTPTQGSRSGQPS